MKRHISKIIVGSLGICIGFALCYFTAVRSETRARTTVVTVTSDGKLTLGSQVLDLSQLSADLKKYSTDGDIITIQASRKADYRQILAVLNACKTAGVTRIAVSASKT